MKKSLFTVGKIILFFIGWVLLVAIPVPETENPAVWRFFAELIPFLSIIAVSIVFWLIEKRKITIYSFKSTAKSLVIGVSGGLLWLGLTFLIMYALGVLKIEGINKVSFIWLWLISVLINTIMQELLVRGYIYQLLKANYNTVAAVTVSTALFTLMHSGAFEAGMVAVLNVLTMSIFMSLVLEYTGSLTAPVIMHFLWNFIGAVVLGGVQLADDYPHIFGAVFSGSKLISGGIYKMEGSAVVLAINLAFIAVTAVILRRKRKICIA